MFNVNINGKALPADLSAQVLAKYTSKTGKVKGLVKSACKDIKADDNPIKI